MSCQKDNRFAVFRRPVRYGYNINELTGSANCPFGAAGNRKKSPNNEWGNKEEIF